MHLIGKTSFIKGLAERLKLNIAYISLVTNLDDDGFLAMLARVPANSVIVMEDFDRSHITEDAKASERNGGSGFPGMEKITEGNIFIYYFRFFCCYDSIIIDKAFYNKRVYYYLFVIIIAGLLNALDGINTPEGTCKLIIMLYFFCLSKRITK